MFKKYFIKLFAITIVVIYGGLCQSAANAAYPVLKLDIGANKNPGEIEPGFDVFTIADSGSTISGITISLAPIEPDPPIPGNPATLNARSRWAPTGIPYEWIYRDLIFSRPGGIRITLSGLWPNQPYEITIWAFDVGSTTGGNRIADWYANGQLCLITNFIGSTPPTDEYSHAFTGSSDSDATGKIVLEAYPDPNTTEQSGANNPYAFIDGLLIASVNPILDATNPVPEDGDTVAATKVQLSWTPGMTATSHKVYFGETFEDVNDANTLDTEYRGSTTNSFFDVGSAGQPYPTGLPVDKTYYWRIDEIKEPDVWKGKVWSFYVPPKTAYNPSPVDGAMFADVNFLDTEVILSWYEAADANSYHVYFGDNQQNVQNGTGGTDKGTVTDTNYDPNMMLQFNTTYYWRVDANDGTTIHTGAVWSFKTSPSVLGRITLNTWENITGGSALNLLTGDPRYPDSPTRSEELTSFDSGNGIGDNYGGRIHGWLYVPLTGDYTFYFTSSAQGQLWLSTDDDPNNLMPEPLAVENVWGNYNVFTHVSDPIPLIGGNKYYIMAIWKDVDFADFCQAAWKGAGIRDQQIIRGCYLSPLVHSTSYNPYPQNVAEDVESNPVLGWTPGEYADKHDVYFGTDFNSVNDANRTNDPCDVLVSQNHNGNYYPISGTLDLDFNRTYYWRIDDVNDPNIYKGAVWSFTTGEYFVVDNMDLYGDDANVPGEPGGPIYYVWRDGWLTDIDPHGNYTGSQVYHWNTYGTDLMESTIVRIGVSMPFYYENDGDTLSKPLLDSANPDNPLYLYSEATVSTSDLPVGSDWTKGDVKALSLWFYGDPNNDAGATEQMYVKLNNSKVLYSGDMDDIKEASWHEWNVELADFGINLGNVTSISIGFGNETNTTTPGGAGIVYFDDIRLYPSRCVLSERSTDFAKADYAPIGSAGDCEVNYQELETMASNWLVEAIVDPEAEEIWREAESADTMSPPLQIWSDRTDASGGQYIAVEPGNNKLDDPNDPNGVATYDFTVEGGTYKIVCLVSTPTADDDSFWLQIPGATTQTTNHESGWVQWNNIAGGTNWHWDIVHSSHDNDTEVEWTMAAGTYTLEISYREDGALLDRLLITDNLDIDEGTLPPLAGDLSMDDKIDFEDFAILAEYWLEEELWP